MSIILNPIVSLLLDKLTDLAKKNLHLILDVAGEIQKLRETLRSIQAVLNDAEQQQITQETVKLWLSNLKDVVYDADDILDEYRIAAEEKASLEHPPDEPSVGSRMLHLFACFRRVKFAHEIGSKIRNLNQRLEQILADMSTFNLIVTDRQNVVAQVRRETSPGVEPDIVGEAIERDTRYLVDRLKKGGEQANSNVVVVAIVGIGGIGKTTLAQKIFNDKEITTVFQKTMWVCVSQKFVETDLLRKIILSAKESPGEARSKEELEPMVMHLLKDKKYLLVLDDVWDAQVWEDLFRKPLHVGAVGSKVLVTTRSQRVAERMKATHTHDMNPLSWDDSWLLLCKKVSKNAEEERDTQSLKDIGMRIVKKCQGLPLAITVIGGVLCGKLSRSEWELVERSSAWSRTGLPNDVHQTLYLSYQDLPSHLRQCFIYCSLIRDDCEPYQPTLVKQLIAEGFVVKVEGEEYPSLEEIAHGYLNELIHRNLLRTSKEAFYGYANCKMHDLLRSLCHFLGRGENLVVTDINKELPSTSHDDSIKLRRLSIATPDSQDIKPIQRLTQRHKSVRTLFLTGLTLDDEDADNCFKNFQRLRVVDLSYTMIQSLPESVGSLLHLRYLNLSGCWGLKALPESISSLRNLQFLMLHRCIQLRTLPMGVVKLCSLRALNLSEVPLEELPSGIAGLEHLIELNGAVFGKVFSDSSSSHSSSCSLEEISKLRKLKELSIFNLVITSHESEQKIKNNLNGLTALKDLVMLYLVCGPSFSRVKQHVERYTKEETERIEKIFDGALHPPTCVREILIDNFFGHQFPRWLMSRSISSFLPNLTKLLLQSCHSCSVLPPLGKLPNLEELDLVRLYAVTSIGVEFFGSQEASTSVVHESGGSKSALSSLVLFPRLKRLYLKSLLNLNEWNWVPEDEGIVSMPQLNELTVESCPELLSLPNGLNHQARLTKLCSIDNTFLQSISEFPYVKGLLISGEICLDIVSHLPALEELQVDLLKPQSLSLPGWLVHSLPHLTSLEVLRLTCKSKRLLYGCLQDGLDWPKINHISVVQIKDDQGNYITYNKHPFTFQTNII